MDLRKLKVTHNRCDMEDMSNPHRKSDYEKRLSEAGVVDLRDNHTIKTLENGRIIVEPIDENKKYTYPSPQTPQPSD